MIRRETGSIFDARRLIVVIDEAEAVLSNSDLLRIVQAIGKGGREVRINLILATQNPNARSMPDLLPQIANRWVGLVTDARTSFNLSGQAGLDCHKLTGQGDFVHIAGVPDRLQVALATQADFDRLPRAEMTPPDFEEVEPLDAAQLPEPRSPGRPREDVDAWKVGFYLAFGPGNVSRRMASETLGLGYDLHIRHRDFTLTALRARKELLKRWTKRR